MHYEMVDGYPMPARFGGHPALDFCNTWAGWRTPPRPGRPVDRSREYLSDFDRLAVWTGHVGLLGPDEVARLRREGHDRPGQGARVLREARRLRTALHDVLLDRAGAEAFGVVADHADRAARRSRLSRAPGGLAARTLPAALGLEIALLAVARSAEELLSDARSTSVRACPADDCGWLFLDPQGRRRWCSMSSCGNRAKVRAHAERKR